MKNSIKLLLLSVVFLCFHLGKINAQFYWFPNSSPPTPNHDLLQVQTGYFTVMGGTGILPSTSLLGMGVGTETPNYMLDVLCGGTGTYRDINISTPTGNPQTAGYRIGGKPVLFTNGDPTSIFAGGQVPLSATYTLTNGYNTCLGYNVCPNLAYSYSNTFAGAWAGFNIIAAIPFSTENEVKLV